MRWVLMLLVVATGCDKLFGLAAFDPDANHDGTTLLGDTNATDAVMVPACTSSGSTIALPPLGDTYLDTIGTHGTSPVLRLGSSQTILLRFALGDLAPMIDSITLKLSVAGSAFGCSTGGTCSLCPMAPGTINAYWARTDWDESVADNQLRTSIVRWDMPGASGPTDRGMPIFALFNSPDPNINITIPFDQNAFQAEWPQHELGIELAASNSYTETFASRENPNNGCVQAAVPSATAKCK